MPLLLAGAVVEVEGDPPGRAGLIVSIRAGEDDVEAGEVEDRGAPLQDSPGKREVAHTERGAATSPRAPRPARADRLAVAGLEVRAAQAPGRQGGRGRAHGVMPIVPSPPPR